MSKEHSEEESEYRRKFDEIVAKYGAPVTKMGPAGWPIPPYTPPYTKRKP